MISENNRFLGGHLVGIGKGLANGEIVYQELKEPIHNRIVSVGLDHLFRWDGTNYVPDYGYSRYLWAGKNTEYTTYYKCHAGALNFMSFGSGSSATSFNDTDLINGSGIYTETRQTSSSSSQDFNGIKINSYGNFSYRISHKSEPVAATTTVREIGWFGGYDNSNVTISSGTKVLFARVVLPSPITLNAGEYLITTYQLDETWSDLTVSTGTRFFGLKDTNGNDLQYEKKRTMAYYPKTNSSFASLTQCTHPWINKNGEGCYDRSGSPGFYAPTFSIEANNWLIGYSSSSSQTFPQDADWEYPDLSSFNGGTFSCTQLDYTGVGSTNKYRDTVIVSGANNPNLENSADGYVDIYYLKVQGVSYRFGYYDSGVWVPQALRKYANQSLEITVRTRYSTEDTTMS